jgi:hypothetical protein
MKIRRLVNELLPYVAVTAVIVGFANFGWYWLEAFTTGVANTGRVVDGHYFLNNRWAGTFTEVSRDAWDWSVFHGSSLFVTHPLAIAAMAYLGSRYNHRRRSSGAPGAVTPTDGGGSSSELGAVEGLPAGAGAIMFLLGMIVTGAMVAFGITWAIPKLGLFGILWTGLAIAIAAVNAWRFLRAA